MLLHQLFIGELLRRLPFAAHLAADAIVKASITKSVVIRGLNHQLIVTKQIKDLG